MAAPGSQMVSLANDRDGGLAMQIRTENDVGAISGTSFSAPYVAGLAALIRSRHPELSALQVIDRITTTAIPAAHGWDPAVGSGVVDPMAALAYNLSPGSTAPSESTLATPAIPEPENLTPRHRTIAGALVCLVLLGLGATTTAVLRRARIQH